MTGKKRWLTLGIAVLCALTLWRARQQAIQKEVASQVVRFHVLANSDAPVDQQIKLWVRDAVLEQARALLAGSQSPGEAEQRLAGHLKELKETADSALAACGSENRSEVTLGDSYFPEKSYGEITLPPGTYRALQVKIGEARGHNWWCMLYPALCFADAVHAVPEEQGEEQLKASLSSRAWQAICKKEKVSFRFYWFS